MLIDPVRKFFTDFTGSQMLIPDDMRYRFKPGQAVLSLPPEKRELLKRLKPEHIQDIRPNKWVNFSVG